MSSTANTSPGGGGLRGAGLIAAGTDNLSLTVSHFPTVFPIGPALGTAMEMTWGSLTDLLRRRREGVKDGPNLVFATFRAEPSGHVRRLKNNVLARTAIALDCETSKATGEIPPALREAAARIEAQGWAGVVYSSHSHSAAAPRYRIVLPLTVEIAAALPAPEVIAETLGLRGVLDESKVNPASVFYLPSAAPGRLSDHETVVTSGAALDAQWVQDRAGALLAAREAAQAKQRAEALAAAEKRRQARLAAGLKPTENLIERIRDRLDLEAELPRHGYEKVGDRYLFSGSSTGIPGVFILRGSDGVERVYSHHAGDPLAAGNLPRWCTVKAVDAVDVLAILDHGGNQKKALHALAKRFGIETPRPGAPARRAPTNGAMPPDVVYGERDEGAAPGDGEPAGNWTDAEMGHDSDTGPQQDTDSPQAPDFDAAIAAIVADFNSRYLMVNEAGKALVFQPGFDPVLKRRHFVRLSTRDLDTLYMNDRVQVGFDENKRPVFKTKSHIWLRHRDRRQYIHGVTFDPRSTAQRPGVLNLWEGFAVSPKAGDWSLMRSHVFSILCAGNQEHFDYLMSWMARMLQRPGEHGEVAVVMKGGEGTGKGTLARALRHIIGQNAIGISNSKHLVGNFNAHLRDAVFLFADEAFYAGDKAHIAVLKSVITEDYLTIEGKFQNAVTVPNYLHLMMASNEEWVVPASLDARRFLVLVASEAAKGNHAYFAEIWAQMEAGGYEAMLHDLLAYDLTAFNVRSVPQTEGLQQQRKLSLPVPEAWWKDCLERGYVFRSRLGLEDYFARWHDEVSTELLFASYMEFADRMHERHPMSREALGRLMVRMKAGPRRLSKTAVGEHLAEEVVNQFGDTQRKAKPIQHPRPQGYHVGSLERAREDFSEETGLSVEWEPPATLTDVRAA